MSNLSNGKPEEKKQEEPKTETPKAEEPKTEEAVESPLDEHKNMMMSGQRPLSRKEGNINLKEGAMGMEDTKRALHRQQHYKIIIPSTETEKADVPLGVNGHIYQVKRDEEVVVPASIIEVLDHAKARFYKQVKREDGNGMDLVPFDALRYPYQNMGKVERVA